MDPMNKINKILSHLETRKEIGRPEDIYPRTINRKNERETFSELLLANLKKGKIDEKEAEVRIKLFAKNKDEENILREIILGSGLARTAAKHSTELNDIKDLFIRNPYKAAFLILSWELGTGGEVDSKKWDINGPQLDESRKRQETKEMEKQRKEDISEKKKYLRAAKNKISYYLGTGEEAKNYSINAEKEDEKRKEQEIKEELKLRNIDLKERTEQLRAHFSRIKHAQSNEQLFNDIKDTLIHIASTLNAIDILRSGLNILPVNLRIASSSLLDNYNSFYRNASMILHQAASDLEEMLNKKLEEEGTEEGTEATPTEITSDMSLIELKIRELKKDLEELNEAIESLKRSKGPEIEQSLEHYNTYKKEIEDKIKELENELKNEIYPEMVTSSANIVIKIADNTENLFLNIYNSLQDNLNKISIGGKNHGKI